MNNRIQELADQAAQDVPGTWMNIPDEFCEKFANLVLAEYAEEYRKLCAGEAVVLPRDRDHAENMVRVGMFYLETAGGIDQ